MSTSINIPSAADKSAGKAPADFYPASASYTSTLSSSTGSTGYRPSTPHPRAARLLASPQPQPAPAVPAVPSTPTHLTMRPAAAAAPTAAEKMKGVANSGSPAASPVQTPHPLAEHRRSLMGSAIARAEHLVVDVGTEEAPRVMACVTSCQGFDWNRSLFLPAFLAGPSDEALMELRREEVAEVVVSEEEAREWLPEWVG